MAERTSATITIGGELTKEQLERLCELCVEEGVGSDWGDRFRRVEEVLAGVRQAAHEARPVVLYDEEASWGRFDELEEWLVDQQLPWVRYSEADAISDPEAVYYYPGLKAPVASTVDVFGEPTVTIVKLDRLYKESLNAHDFVRGVLALINERRIPEVPPILLADST